MNIDPAPPTPEWEKVAAKLVSRLSEAIKARNVVPEHHVRSTAQSLVDQAIKDAKKDLPDGKALPVGSQVAAWWGAISSLIDFLEQQQPSADTKDWPFDGEELRKLCASFAERDEDFDFDEWSFAVVVYAVSECSLEVQPKQPDPRSR